MGMTNLLAECESLKRTTLRRGVILKLVPGLALLMEYRLPKDVRPSRYDIHLRAEVGKPRFEASVRIYLDVGRATRELHLHARDLDVKRASIGDIVASVELFAKEERLLLRLPQELPEGSAVVDIEYEGVVSASMQGLYLSKDGAQEVLSTQCEETDARAIFPCMDEPEFKASLAWTVTTSPDATVLTNAPLARRDGNTWVFEPTARISTYLAAVCVGRIASSPERKLGDIPFRVWAYQGKEHLGDYANELSTRLLPWFVDYFGQPYPYKKYDQVAVPSFSAGAMENAGLVIFRQALLLRDPKTTSFRNEVQIARVVSHEMAHMWFGNLVTMAWWDDIWLNESFAEWVAHKCLDAVAPQYRVWGEQQAEKMSAMTSDALESTHPIYNAVERAEQATELFDAITYYKGAAVMRMLEAFLGHEPFRAGMRSYMRQFREKNARGADLWRHLGSASGQPVERVMESWIMQGGHPVLHVRLEDGGLVLRQARFLSSPTAAPPDQSWLVPVVVRHDKGEARALLAAQETRVPLPSGVRWAYANADGIGFYRLDPDASLFETWLASVSELTTAEQATLVDDQWALLRKGAAPADRFLRVADALLRVAHDDRVLSLLTGRLLAVEDMIQDEHDAKALDAMRAWVRGHLASRLDKEGIEARPGESPPDALRRAALLFALASLGHEPRAIEVARSIAANERTAPASVDANLADPSTAIAAQFGDARMLDAYFAEYDQRRKAGAPPAQVQRYLNALIEFRDPALVRRVLDRVTSGELPLEAGGPILRLALTRRHANVETWRHIQSHWAFVRERLGDQWTGFIIERAGSLPVEMRDDVKRFFDQHVKGVADQTAARALEMLDQRAQVEPRLRKELASWFRGKTEA